MTFIFELFIALGAHQPHSFKLTKNERGKLSVSCGEQAEATRAAPGPPPRPLPGSPRPSHVAPPIRGSLRPPGDAPPRPAHAHSHPAPPGRSSSALSFSAAPRPVLTAVLARPLPAAAGRRAGDVIEPGNGLAALRAAPRLLSGRVPRGAAIPSERETSTRGLERAPRAGCSRRRRRLRWAPRSRGGWCRAGPPAARRRARSPRRRPVCCVPAS